MYENKVVYMVARVDEDGNVLFDLGTNLNQMEKIAKDNNEAIVRIKPVDARVLEIECMSLLATQIERGKVVAKQIRVDKEKAERLAELRSQMSILQREIDELE